MAGAQQQPKIKGKTQKTEIWNETQRAYCNKIVKLWIEWEAHSWNKTKPTKDTEHWAPNTRTKWHIERKKKKNSFEKSRFQSRFDGCSLYGVYILWIGVLVSFKLYFNKILRMHRIK